MCSVGGDIARVSRLPNTPHKSGYFCVPLTARDVGIGANHIRELAKQPRYDFDLDIIIKDNIRINDRVVPGLLKKLLEDSSQKKKYRWLSPIRSQEFSAARSLCSVHFIKMTFPVCP
jgi:hypothetical protein